MNGTYTKSKLRNIVHQHWCWDPTKATDPEAIDILFRLEDVLCRHHLDAIAERKKKISRLEILHQGMVNVWNGPLTRGCEICVSYDETWTAARNSERCQLKCEFCYYFGQPEKRMSKSRIGMDVPRVNRVQLDEYLILLERQHRKGVGWAQKEPLLEMEKIRWLMPKIADLNIYQWLYTNGLLVTEEMSKELADLGLNELRFNLQATDFSDEVMSNMETARKYIDIIGIETPTYSKSFKNYMKHKERLLGMGIKQINALELELTPLSLKNFYNEGLVYRHRIGYTSPLSSRHYVYDLIEVADKENWPLCINDCSNDNKYWRSSFGGFSDYPSRMGMPMASYLRAIDLIEGDTLEVW